MICRSRGASWRRRKRLGFGLKIHVDEFEPLGGTPLAVELGATSADHIVTTPPEHVALLARSATRSAWRCPARRSGWRIRDYSPGRALIDQGGALALATDLNPGTSWCENMQMMMALACRYMRLLPAEALVAATLNAAYAIGLGASRRQPRTGQAGRPADARRGRLPDAAVPVRDESGADGGEAAVAWADA